MTSTVDRVRPQDDLFRHVNGAWLETAEIPADQSIYGAFHEMRDDSELACRTIVDELAAGGAAEPGSAEQLIADLYRSFMDTETVEKLGMSVLEPQLRQIAAVSSVDQLFGLLGEMARDGVGGLFGFFVDNDPVQPEKYTLQLNQGGLGLPDEAYYRDPQYEPIRRAYLKYLQTMLALARVRDAESEASAILALETKIAAGHWDRVKSRDSDLTNNPMDRTGLSSLWPESWWAAWLAGIAAPLGVLDHVIVRQPSFYESLRDLLTPGELPTWRAWLSLRVIRAAAPVGPDSLVQANFEFYGRTLSGTPDLRERWKRGVGMVESAVGEALGELYVQRHFPPAAKERMDELVQYLIRAYEQEIAQLSWMTESTKTRALEKLAAFNPKVGYPNRWRDYGALVIRADDLVGNARRSAAFETDRELAKVGKPVDRDEWLMTPQTVNAYYNPGMNEIVFPAAILRPPFFDLAADDAVNFGAIGAVIGHEIGHGFDDQGSKYDGTGAIQDWWTAEDRVAFETLTKRLIGQYSELEPAEAPGNKVNGALTIGENIGDLGGLGIAFQAWQLSLNDAPPPVIHGVTGAQRLFIAWATVWRTKGREAEVLRRLAIDPHSPPEFRCNQVVRNLDEFYAAFDVRETDALWLDPADRVRIW